MDKLKEKWDIIASITKDILLDRYYKTCKRKADEFPTNSSYHLWCKEFKGNLEDVIQTWNFINWLYWFKRGNRSNKW